MAQAGSKRQRRSNQPKQPIIPDAIYSLAECGDLATVSMVTIWKHVRTGALRSSRIGRRIVVTGRDLAQFIADRVLRLSRSDKAA